MRFKKESIVRTISLIATMLFLCLLVQVNTTLSLVATIFLPLTFLTGVFGMNFQYEGKYPVGIGLLNEE